MSNHTPRRSGVGIRRVLNPVTGKPPLHPMSMLAVAVRQQLALEAIAREQAAAEQEEVA